MNEVLTYLLSQAVTLMGIAIFAWIFGKSFANGVSGELKKLAVEIKTDVPEWIHNYVKQTREARTIADARDKMNSIREEHAI